MKQYGFVYNSFEKMKAFVYHKDINNSNSILIQVFTGVAKREFIKNIVDEILSILPQAKIIGTTTGGEIFNKKVLENSTVISFTIFEKTKIKSKLLNNNKNEYELGINIAKELIEEDTKVLILFSDGLLTNSFNILEGIQSANKDIIVCGGKAGDNAYLKETFIFTENGITNNGAVAISLTGRELNVITEYSLGCSSIGKLMTITKAYNNRVYTIDNIKAVDIYKKYLGDEVANGLPMSGVEFPLMVIKDGIQIAKAPYEYNEDGSLTFFSNVEINDKVRFGYGNINRLMNESLEIYDRLIKRNIEVLFVYSCFVRKSFLQEKTSVEIGVLSDIAPTFGFFTYGEFFTVNNSNRLLNAAMTILGLSEEKDNSNNNKFQVSKELFKEKDLVAIKAFTNLVNEATKELEGANRTLEEQKLKIKKMNSITKAILEMNVEMIASGKFDDFIEMILDKILDVIRKGKMGSILLVENDRLIYKATRGYVLNKIKHMIPYSIKKIYKYNEVTGGGLFSPIILKNIEKPILMDAEEGNGWRDILKEQPKEILTCCIGIDEQVVGLVNIFNTDKEEDFNEQDKNILKYICYDVAIAVKNFRMLNNVLHMSRYDSLTGVCNRNYFMELLTGILNRSKVLEKRFIICGVDLNDFKTINDTYGHDKGDEVLKKFAAAFKDELNEDEILGRIGGDEFLVAFLNKNKKQVIEIIDKIYIKLQEYKIEINGYIKNVGFSYGLSEFLVDSEDIDELIKIADKRMYEKKKMMKIKK